MRITIGVDGPERIQLTPTLQIIEAMRFPAPHIELVHVIERWNGPDTAAKGAIHLDLIKKYLRLQEEQGDKILAEAKTEATGCGFESLNSHLAFGLIANSLIDRSVATHTDLLALGSSGKRPLEGVLIGSVARKAVISSPKSVLVTKTQLRPRRPLTIVFATDHSPYADACLAQFAKWQPRGIGTFVLVTVFPEEIVRAMTSVMDHFKADIGGWLRRELEEANHQGLAPFRDMGFDCVSRVESGPVSETLARVMAEEKGDLLVLGAQGHGFLDRITMGSISLDQVVSKPYSVLIMRQP